MLFGCADPDGSPLPTESFPPPAPDNDRPSFGALLAPGCTTPSGTAYLFKCWTNQGVINVATIDTSSVIKGAIQDGVGKWNGLLNLAPTSYRRSFGWNDTVTATADVVFHVMGTSTVGPYCGREFGGSSVILYPLTDEHCPSGGSWYGDVATVVAHELSTVLGWRDDIETHGVAGISDQWCVSTWRSLTPGPLSTTACYHDVDGVLKLYRNGSVNLGTWNDYFGTKILASSDAALSASTVQVGQSVNITAQYLRAGPHAQYSAQVAYGPGAYQAIPSPSGKVHQSGNTIVADDTGTVTIQLRPGGPPSGYALWEPLQSEGVSYSLTITSPPPPPPFRVDQITPDTGAITVPGWQTFTAHVVSAPGTPFTTRWIIVDSRTPTVADTVWNYSSPTTSVQIAAGASYTLTLRARPYWSETIGFEFTQDIPVCTGGGVAVMLGAGITPPTTDAVGGCSSGGGGNN